MIFGVADLVIAADSEKDLEKEPDIDTENVLVLLRSMDSVMVFVGVADALGVADTDGSGDFDSVIDTSSVSERDCEPSGLSEEVGVGVGGGVMVLDTVGVNDGVAEVDNASVSLATVLDWV